MTRHNLWSPLLSMTLGQSYAQCFKRLRAKLEIIRKKAEERTWEYDELLKAGHGPKERRQILLNRLRHMAGRKMKPLVVAHKQEDIEDLLPKRGDVDDPQKHLCKGAKLFASRLASHLIEPVAEDAGILTLAAFRHNLLSASSGLQREFQKYLIKSPPSSSGTKIWSKIVVPCLRDEDPDQFSHTQKNDPWAPVDVSITACNILAEQLNPAGGKPARRRKALPTEDEVMALLGKLGLTGTEQKPYQYYYDKWGITGSSLKGAKKYLPGTTSDPKNANLYVAGDVVKHWYARLVRWLPRPDARGQAGNQLGTPRTPPRPSC